MTGRPRFEPAPAQRERVRTLAAAGMGQTGIAADIGIARNTLAVRFAAELAQGAQARREAREASEVERVRRRAEVIRLLFEAAQKGSVAAMVRLERLTRRGARS